MEQVLLTIQDLEKSYGDTRALQGISLTFQPGEFVVIIGPSGAGKSTFIRCINRMIDPSAGSITFDGQRVDQLKGRQLRSLRAGIGMIFQHYNLVERTNVLRNVLHGRLGQMPFWQSALGLYSQQDREEAVELLEQVGLADQMYKRADALSGGQMQRVGICRAILQHPKLLLADEPIASLDPKSADIVMDHLQQVTRQRGLTCIVNLHQVDYARRYATRVVAIRGGRVVFDGRPEELTDDITAAVYAGKESQMTLSGQPELRLRPAEV